jgi:tetratricopeptide (TPR) repeat protein
MPAMRKLLLCLLCLAALDAFAGGCKREPAAAWPVRLVGDRPFVDGAVNGTKINVLVDTAAYASLITGAAAQRLKLKVDYRTTESLRDGSQVGIAKLDELRIGDKVTKGSSVRVVGDLPADVDFILGVDFTSSYDLELDLPGRFVRVFTPARCPGESLAYWDANASEVELQKARATILPVTLNGKRAVAMLYSGLAASRVSPAFAEELGMKPGMAGVLPAGCSSGKSIWMSKFDLSIGKRMFDDARLYVGPTQGGVDVYLGADFLRTHRVLASTSRGTLYFTDMGGLPFMARPWLRCDEAMLGKSRQEMLDHLDATLTRDARDANALLWRASMQRRENPKEALADLAAAIALEPSNAAAFSLRAEVHKNLKDHAAAIADMDKAIALGIVTTEIYTARAELHRRRGDLARAIEDYGESLRIDPRYPAPLQTRGRLLYHAGRYEDADRDFTALVAVSPRWANRAWRSMALARRGLESGAPLEAARASLKDDEWPAPLLDHLMGRLDRDALMSKAAVEDHKVRRERQCEAAYYAGARLGGLALHEQACPLLQQATRECQEDELEHESALLELKGLS